jgi:hypothetical protein
MLDDKRTSMITSPDHACYSVIQPKAVVTVHAIFQTRKSSYKKTLGEHYSIERPIIRKATFYGRRFDKLVVTVDFKSKTGPFYHPLL